MGCSGGLGYVHAKDERDFCPYIASYRFEDYNIRSLIMLATFLLVSPFESVAQLAHFASLDDSLSDARVKLTAITKPKKKKGHELFSECAMPPRRILDNSIASERLAEYTYDDY